MPPSNHTPCIKTSEAQERAFTATNQPAQQDQPKPTQANTGSFAAAAQPPPPKEQARRQKAGTAPTGSPSRVQRRSSTGTGPRGTVRLPGRTAPKAPQAYPQPSPQPRRTRPISLPGQSHKSRCGRHPAQRGGAGTPRASTPSLISSTYLGQVESSTAAASGRRSRAGTRPRMALE